LYLLRAAVSEGEVALAVTLVITSLVAYYYYLRIVWKMYFDRAPEGLETPARAPASFRWTVAACAGALIVAGLLPGGLIDRARDAVSEPPSAAAAGVREVEPADASTLSGAAAPTRNPAGSPPR
ncbi:MAG: hypothetical protein R3266_06240, partial [Gemmatimonadota bacterium]|nr:hypothetical protein [Gemmatimonadota bacterium]